jgi:putative PIN family toxin of toxin-antitoxin system
VRIVLDTNVLISGIFFTGPPFQILEAWRDGNLQILVSPAILEEYRRVMNELVSQFEAVNPDPFLDLLTLRSEIVLAPLMPRVIKEDPSDDKFLECAVAGKAACIVSGDKHLLKLSEFRGIRILTPRHFIQMYLKG